MHRLVAHLAYENRVLHLLLGEVSLPPVLSMTVSGNQVMFAVNFVDSAELARHLWSPYTFYTSRIRFYFKNVSNMITGVWGLMLCEVLAAK